MKVLYVIKVGTTFPTTAQRLGDFDMWTLGSLGSPSVTTNVLDVEHGADLPSPQECAGVVITGSHAMVTDKLTWSVKLEEWIPALIEKRVPVFGICYGHQLLAEATGGHVAYHPKGQEIGTVKVMLEPGASNDPVFGSLPRSFLAHATHSQSVLELPPGAVRIGGNEYEPNHAFRLGENAWGVQFHPEYDAEIMRAYIEEQSEGLTSRGVDVGHLLAGIEETPEALRAIRNFAVFVETRTKAGNTSRGNGSD